VVLLVQHSPAGSVGLILNRPSALKLGIGKGGLKFGIIGAPGGMQETFAANRVYCGGMVRQDVSASMRQQQQRGFSRLPDSAYPATFYSFVGSQAAKPQYPSWQHLPGWCWFLLSRGSGVHGAAAVAQR
jgi:hypothetical protein